MDGGQGCGGVGVGEEAGEGGEDPSIRPCALHQREGSYCDGNGKGFGVSRRLP